MACGLPFSTALTKRPESDMSEANNAVAMLKFLGCVFVMFSALRFCVVRELVRVCYSFSAVCSLVCCPRSKRSSVDLACGRAVLASVPPGATNGSTQPPGDMDGLGAIHF